ncbi:hypothetical protein M758_2G056800 [Ceratodon purpureus]|nr:hypothetical protein M758_2G056800 [Ceratodon purpureus]
MAGDDARSSSQVVVVGDHGTGKSSVMIALATDSFPEKPPLCCHPLASRRTFTLIAFRSPSSTRLRGKKIRSRRRWNARRRICSFDLFL